MGYQIPNSNQFASWQAGKYILPSDLLIGQKGSNLPDTQTELISEESVVLIKFILRRKEFERKDAPENYKTTKRILNLPYEKQVKFINSLSANELTAWYGASYEDEINVIEYINSFNGTVIEADPEERFIRARFSLGDFRKAFLAGKPDVVFNWDQSTFYYDPNDFANSYLETDRAGGKEAAEAIIGVDVEIQGIQGSAGLSSASAQGDTSNESYASASKEKKIAYYPSELGEIYRYPSNKATNGGSGVTIGLVGMGGNQFESILEKGNAFNRYLKAQGIRPSELGSVISPNSPDNLGDPDWYGESALDYSILRSIAPRSDLVISQNVDLYQAYSELIFDKRIDIISSSVSRLGDLGFYSQKDAFGELFVDAVLRGKPVVVASGDRGTANNTSFLPNGSAIPNFTEGDSAVLSVGGTAFSAKTKQLGRERPTIGLMELTKLPKPLSEQRIDAITGLIEDQYVWNERVTKRVDNIGNARIYPGFANDFTADDFVGSANITDYFLAPVASSGVFDSKTMPMPNYQRKNLSKYWRDSGRRYPDISVLAGSSVEHDTVSNYYYLTAKLNEDKTGFVPVLSSNGKGTSAGAPLVAGLLANLTSHIRQKFGKGKKLGMVNPLLYEAYKNKKRGEVLFDVPAGSNNASVVGVATSPADWAGYSLTYIPPSHDVVYAIPVNGTDANGMLDTDLSRTGSGFDAATGLGSINGYGLLNELVSAFENIYGWRW